MWSGHSCPLHLILVLILIFVSVRTFSFQITVKAGGQECPPHTPAILSLMKSVIVGTAGHIDHGKTALVKALTGIDADRLEEEKRRGITIDIGFATSNFPPPMAASCAWAFVDVPGHERFVRNMLAGVGGIDLVLLVIAADEGIKPQTRDTSISAACWRSNAASPCSQNPMQWMRKRSKSCGWKWKITCADHFSIRQNRPVIAVSSLTGRGLDELKSALAQVASEVAAKDSAALARLPIDRVFTMKGFGTVVTGTLVAGTIRKSDEEELELFPPASGYEFGACRFMARPRKLPSQAAHRPEPRRRLNEDLARGMTLATADTFRSTSRVDALLSLLPSAKPLKDGARGALFTPTRRK